MSKCATLITIAKWTVIVLALAFLLLNLVAACFINRMMFHPDPSSYDKQAKNLVFIPDAKGDIAAFWIPRYNAKKAILYCHGNGEDIGETVPVLHGLLNAGFSVLAMDYPGYGLPQGKPSEKEVYRSADAAYRYLTGEKGFAPENITVLGFSIGSGTACYLAEKYPVGGLVFQCGFTSAPRTVTRARILIQDPFPNIRRIRNIKCPKLFLHGDADKIVPYALGQKVFEAAPEPKQFIGIPGAGHNDVPYTMPPGAYINLISRFAGLKTEL